MVTLKFISGWFVRNKILERFYDALLHDDILLFDENVSKVTFFANEMGILGVDLDKTNFYDDDKF